MPTKRAYLLFLYSTSIFLSILLFLWSGIYCHLYRCAVGISDAKISTDSIESWFKASGYQFLEYDKTIDYAPTFPLIVSLILILLSTTWLVNNTVYIATECMRNCNCLEMPTAVFCSLLAGVCAVVEIHYTYHNQIPSWGEKWSFPATSSAILLIVHAAIVFALS
uniref:Cornichon family AMPA receptor auxiliary protein 2 n=1 Tax=Rhabditophanes sp. KR3021 TaxID=114890 RepID=A0AC35U5K8_9BILA